MTYRLEDFAYDYRITTGASASRAPSDGFERVGVAGGHEVRRVIEGASRSHGPRSALRSLLKSEAPLEQVHRLSDRDVRERAVGLVSRRSAVMWRKPRRTGSSAVGAPRGAPELADSGPAADALTLAQAAPAAPAVPGPLRCGDAWAAIDAEVEAVLAHGGDADPITRNRHISAAYAQLYRREPSLTWGGLAAIVSRQAGCAMDDAKEMADSWRPGPTTPRSPTERWPTPTS